MTHNPLPAAECEPKLLAADAPLALFSDLSAAADPDRLIDQITRAGDRAGQQRLNVDPAEVRRGLGRVVLTLVKLLHEVLERQAVRRMESGSLSDEQLERLGTTLMLQAREIRSLCREFGIEEADLNLDLGPLGRLL